MNYKSIFYLLSENDTESSVNEILMNKDVNDVDDIGQTLLGMAIIYRRYDLINFLVQNGADVEKISDGMYPVEEACAIPDYKIVKMLIEAGASVSGDNRALGICVSNRGDYDIVKYLIDSGADVNGKYAGETVLWWACQAMNKEVVELLLKNGANPNVINDVGLTCLKQAIGDAFLSGVKLLIKYGADVNACKGDSTIALQMASTYCYPAIDVLLDAGADINAVDDLGRTVLFEERVKNKFSSCDYLIKRGANPYIKDIYGYDFFMLDDDELRRKINEDMGYYEETDKFIYPE